MSPIPGLFNGFGRSHGQPERKRRFHRRPAGGYAAHPRAKAIATRGTREINHNRSARRPPIRGGCDPAASRGHDVANGGAHPVTPEPGSGPPPKPRCGRPTPTATAQHRQATLIAIASDSGIASARTFLHGHARVSGTPGHPGHVSELARREYAVKGVMYNALTAK